MHCAPLLGRHGPDAVVEAGDGDFAVVPVEPGQDHVQGHGSVGKRAAGHAAVHRHFGTLDLDQGGDNAAQRVRDAGKADLDVLRIADDDDIGLNPLLMFPEEGFQVA